MPPIQFRLRTLMIAIAAFALLVVLLKSLTQPFFDNMIAFTAAVVLLVMTTGGLLLLVLAFLFAAVAELFSFAVDIWHGRTEQRQFMRTANSQLGSPRPGQSGGAERV
jgi:hypothetical protein